MEFKRTLTFWTAVACLCGGPLAAQETVGISVTETNGVSRIIEVHRGISSIDGNFFFGRKPLSSIRLPNGLTELRSFGIGQPSLTNLTLPERLTKLEQLHIQGTGLTSLTLPEGLPNLRWLKLSSNQLTDFTLPRGLTNLERLNLIGNQLRSLSLPEGLTSLKYLGLQMNQLTSLTLPEGLASLERLDLARNQLASLTLPQGLTSFQHLDMRYNQLTNLTLPEGLTNLQHLDIRYNQLTNLVVPPGTSSQWGGNFWLYISGNPFMEIRLPVGFSEPTRYDVGRGLRERELYRISYYDPLSVAPSSPKISISRGENGLEISWESGVLQKSAGVEGPWEDVNASSPLQVRPSLPAEFFRVRAE